RNRISRIPDRHLTYIQEEGSYRVRDNANLTAGALRRIPRSTLSRIQENGGSHVRGVVDDVHNRLRNLNGYTASTYITNTTRNQVIWDYYQNNMGGTGRPPNAGMFASGGYTGRGGKYEPAGIVHRGEYVIPKQYVNQSTGLPYADALGKLVKGANPTGNYARGGFVQPMTQNG